MRLLVAIALVAALVTLAGCAPQVSAGCNSDADCASRCVEDDHAFPHGMCTMSCAKNEDCPMGALCVERHDDALCAVECSSMQQCAAFGAGYICKDHKDVHGDQQLVCWGD